MPNPNLLEHLEATTENILRGIALVNGDANSGEYINNDIQCVVLAINSSNVEKFIMDGSIKLLEITKTNHDVGDDLSIDNLKNYTDQLSKLQKLNLDRTQVTGDIASLKNLRDLIILSLSETQVTGKIASLRELQQLKILILTRTEVTGDIASLNGATNLIRLYLSSTLVTGDIASLRELPNLTHLDLRNTQVSGDNASELPNLTELYLPDNQQQFIITSSVNGGRKKTRRKKRQRKKTRIKKTRRKKRQRKKRQRKSK